MLFAALILPLPPSGTPDGSASLEGTVYDLSSGLVIEGAQVTIVGSGQQASTNRAGQFSFGSESLRTSDTLVVTHRDFVPVTIPLGDPPDDGWMLRIRLLPDRVGVGDRADSTEVRP